MQLTIGKYKPVNDTRNEIFELILANYWEGNNILMDTHILTILEASTHGVAYAVDNQKHE